MIALALFLKTTGRKGWMLYVPMTFMFLVTMSALVLSVVGIAGKLASGDFTVDAATKEQAQKDIAEDGYWGVNQTSDRIVDFAKALAGDDPAKADKMIEAFQKGYKEATKTWGKTLPDISSRTYDAVMEKMNKWKNGEEAATTEE